MLEFAIFVIVIIAVSVVSKTAKRSATRDGTPNPRVQKLIERIQAQQGGNQPIQFQGQFTQAPPIQYRPPAQYQPANPYQPPAHQPAQNNLPTPTRDTDARVRELMRVGNEVAAVRLLCDEQDLSILEAQKYARSLMAPAGTSKPATTGTNEPEQDEDDTRYVGSAAFAESIFAVDDRDENVWASGWVDTPEPDDRSDIDELWQTVRNPPRPGATPAS
jgi:hypothetical protein